MKIWLDDERPAPAGFVCITSAKQLQAYLEQPEVRVQLLEMSLDHDLGPGHMTGSQFTKWLQERIVVDAWEFPNVEVIVLHSHNAIGARAMKYDLERVGFYVEVYPYVTPTMFDAGIRDSSN